MRIHGEVHLRDLRLEEVKGEQDLRLCEEEERLEASAQGEIMEGHQAVETFRRWETMAAGEGGGSAGGSAEGGGVGR